MDVRVTLSEDPATVLDVVGDYLSAEPVLHNLILSLLHERLAHAEPGRYWIATRGGKVAGVVFQSPLTFGAQVSLMESNTVVQMAETICDMGVDLPGINGEVAVAARFAGQWSERRRCAVVPFQGMRLYELEKLREIAIVEGKLRPAVPRDRDLLVAWVRAFQMEIREPVGDPEVRVDQWMTAGQLWLWDNGQPVSMAVSRGPVAGVIRVAGVYTPPEQRRRGYAEACVHSLSSRLLEGGHRSILYTDLGNPTSNSIYRRIGYKAVAEVLRYRFE